ncbi:glycoside hydrolase family 9 protein [Clostridium cellulovorans]|uniref:Glucanase n=2 Tax=Clostridium cellulovorans TaxID=1493 RepID=D9SS68_CLOC7|nr:glycoside hydrolase family 9 protein [Clostridium cellulovorans]AAF06109.1 endoglucanase L [Clostridium cellulovorans 743B]ADL52515.1 glycoside hydrolase family 9 [Clostridium cellulovorans 743B]
MKKIIATATSLCLSAGIILPATEAAAAPKFDYSDAFGKSIMFYEANWSGKVENNRFDWRGDAFLKDGADVGLDLSGGFFDAGDHVKFGLPQAYAASTLGWGYFAFKDAYKSNGQDAYMLKILKHFTDYFLKCYPDNNTFYYQVGDGDLDHAYWGPPEIQPTARPTKFKATPSDPASDVCGNTAAALAIMYLNYKDVDATYANKCLTAAKNLYSLGKNYKGLSHGQSYYVSTSYYDDLAWGAVWLYQATNDNSYMTDANSFLSQINADGDKVYTSYWTHCWDNVWTGVIYKMAEVTGKANYKASVENNLNYWMNNIKTTAGGLKFATDWGSLRYSSTQAMLALIQYNRTKEQKYLDFATRQIDYILGDNPRSSSYVVGFGNNYPKFPHHRGASGRLEPGEMKTMPEKHILTGALVGGPDGNDQYKDDINNYQQTEVAIDYSAGFVGAMAGITKYLDPAPIIIDPITYALGDVNKDGKVNAIDLAILKKNLLNGITGDLTVSDMNKDGKVNAIDLALLKKLLLG